MMTLTSGGLSTIPKIPQFPPFASMQHIIYTFDFNIQNLSSDQLYSSR